MVNKRNVYPLIHSQKRIWYIEKIYPGLPIHNIGGLIWINGEVNIELLEEAIHLFVQKHEGLRIQLTELEGRVFQYFEPYSRRKLGVYNFSEYEDRQAAVSSWAEMEFSKPFELLEHPLFEFAIVRVSERLNGYFVKIHHVAADGWSIQIMTEEITQFYTMLRNGETIELSIERGYIDYILQENSYLSSKRFERNKRYWLDKFRDIPESFLQKGSNKLIGKRKTFWMQQSLSQAIREYGVTNRCSLNTFFLVLVLLHQHKITQQRELIIGTPVLNRSGIKEKRIVGMFTSTLPFRTTVESEESIASFVSRINKELMECYYHQRFPYDLLIQQLELRKKGYDQLFQISVNYYNTKLSNVWEGNVIENEELYCGQQLYSLQVVIKEWDTTGRLAIQMDYRSSEHTVDYIEKLFQRLVVLAEQVVNMKKEMTVGCLKLMAESERYALVNGRNETEQQYPKDKQVHQLITDQAIKSPQKTAAVWKTQSLTYAELDDYANRLAHRLASEGIGRGSIAALLFNHSFETLISILAVLKTGAAYLPIDTVYPGQRIRYLLEDSQANILLCNVVVPEEVGYSGKLLMVDRSMLDSLPLNVESFANMVSPYDPAYIMYTSGSTGNPKGVVIKHQGLMNYCWWASKTYYTEERDVAALYSSLAFDLTITSIFPPLMNGNSIAIYPAYGDRFILDQIISDNIATVIKLTPAHLMLIKERDYSSSSIRLLVVGGENLKSAVAADIHASFGGRVMLINEYGPTETVVGCIIHRFDPSTDCQGSVPIGLPIANTQIYLLDDQLQPVPDGVIGELYIAGDGVALGYLGRQELTQKQFIWNPFTENGTMYRTNDLAFWRPDGSIEYVGRNDSQIKVNGYRIELGEIENHLIRVEGIRDAVVIACHDDRGTTALAAYLVADRKDINSFAVRQALLEMVPAYMVPSYVLFLDMLPINSNGKVDRQALPDPKAGGLWCAPEQGPVEYQEMLLAVMREVLQTEHITLQDNFYQLGGDSIKAIQVMSKLNEVGLNLQVNDILSFPVIGELIFVIKKNQPKTNEAAVEGDVKPTPITDWFFAMGLENPHHYNQSVLLSLQQKLSSEQIFVALNELTRHHDNFRLKLNESNGLLHYCELSGQGNSLEVVSIENLSQEEKERAIKERSLACKKSLHLVEGPLFKGILFDTGNGNDLLFLTAHHLIIDAVSWRIVLEDLERVITASSTGKPTPMPAKSDSYQAWAETYWEGIESKYDNELKYWGDVLQSVELPLDADYESGMSTIADTATARVELSKEETLRLMTSANEAYSTRPGELLMVALALACQSMSGRRKFTIEIESHGREPAVSGEIDVSRTIGWFTSIYPASLDVPDSDISIQLKEIKEQLRKVPNHGIGYGGLTLTRKLPAHAVQTVRFNYLGQIDDRLTHSLFEFTHYDTGEEQAMENAFTPLLDIVSFVEDNQFQLSVTYSTKVFVAATIERFMHLYMKWLQELIHHCCEKEGVEFTPSDFKTISLSQSELDNLFV